jgi:hypothetical protein
LTGPGDPLLCLFILQPLSLIRSAHTLLTIPPTNHYQDNVHIHRYLYAPGPRIGRFETPPKLHTRISDRSRRYLCVSYPFDVDTKLMDRSYSSLIVFNPAAAPTSSGSSSDAFLTPSGVVLPQASATLSLQGNLPSVSESSSQASESGVRVVGQGSSALGSGTGNGTSDGGGDTEVVKENAATTMAVGEWMFVGVGSALVAVLA